MMSSDPRFDVYPDEFEQAQRRRTKWTTCLIGCLAIFVLMMLFVIAAAVWVGRNWRGWTADLGLQVLNQGIDTSDLPAAEKDEVKVQVKRIATGFRDGKISAEQLGTIVQKLAQSPLMPTFVVMAVDKQYFNRSGLSDEEKAQGRKDLKRFARGMIDGKIDQKGIDAIMSHIADRKPDGEWQLRQNVSDADLRAALAEAKSRADEAGIAEEPENVDPSDEFKRIIDEALNEGALGSESEAKEGDTP